MDDFSGRSHGAEREVELPARKKGKKGSTRGKEAESVQVPPEQFVRIVPVREQTAEDDVQDEVLLSKVDRAPHLLLSDDRLSVTGEKGFRTVRATHGYHSGTYYCEATVQHLGKTGHCRIGWSTKKAELNAPIGYDQYGLSYRDVDGSMYHKALREDYGTPYGEGDVIGLFIHLPPGGRTLESRTAELLRYKGHLYQRVEDNEEPQTLEGSLAGFSKNGVWQGIAFQDFPEGVYYPGVALFTKPGEFATVSFNFGPDFKYPVPAVEGCPAAEPISVLPSKWTADEAAAAGEASSAVAEAEYIDEAAVADTAAAEDAVNVDTGEGPQPVAG
eukprot:GHUV01001340.1.p1 GENE.GHUV01001340.1~~GHUV01001340.1.p1  ORF type:complete len:330 (+),score=92.94 GHUV01001340.1:338-1327(+)